MSLIDRIKQGWARAQAALPFGINNWPSWLNEGAAGLVLMGAPFILFMWLHWYIAACIWLLVAHSGSEAYENFFDNWGYNPQDVLERDRGLFAAVVLGILASLL